MNHAAEFRRCLLELDVPGVLRLWQHVAPHLPQPATHDEALVTLHTARLAMTTLADTARQYSKAWLAERQTSTIVRAVGIAVGFADEADPAQRSRAGEIRQVMEGAVLDALAAGVDLETEAAEVSRRMQAARRGVVGRR